MHFHLRFVGVLIVVAGAFVSSLRAGDPVESAQALGRARPAVIAQPDGLIVCEGEEFQVGSPGWTARRFGENYYAATFANAFLSRKAFLGAPEQCAETTASLRVEIPKAGRYLALARYEAAYRFETQFRLRIEQAGKPVLDRRYGARDNVKVWAFGKKLQTEVGWSWGAVENVVWEGRDAFVELQPGPATLTLIAGPQPEPGARRNVDLVMLTTNVADVAMRIEKEKYLPLDGMLTQSGDVWLRVRNAGAQPLIFKGGKAGGAGKGNWTQHSPYWVHLRTWEAPEIKVTVGQTSDWVEVGGTMDTLADGQWYWTGNGPYEAEFGWKDAAGTIQPLAKFSGEGDLALAGRADTRYSRELRTLDHVLYNLLDFLKAQPVHGRTPTLTPIYATTFQPLDEGRHAAAVREFQEMFGLTTPREKGGMAPARGYIDVRGVKTPQLADYCAKLGDQAKEVAVVSLGDEISLPRPAGAKVSDEFRAWLKERGLKPGDVDPDAKDWDGIDYDKADATRETRPGVYYWSKRYLHDFGIHAIKERTDILRKHLPNAAVGANYSPHYPQEHMFLGEVHKWVSIFREQGMTQPWSEDYIWQVAVGTPQMNHINLDLFRAGLRHHPEGKIHYYVMPHMPNNTPNQWRRLFYGALAHGMKIVNLFEFRPVHAAYTENHVDEPAMYAEVLRSFRELGLFEDIVQNGRVQGAEAALWFSETGDIWGDSKGSFAAGKRALYTAIRHQQIPLDFVVEADALDGTLKQYKALYLTDAHVSQAASAKMAEWVKDGGHLFATAGAGMFDELNRPNAVLRKLMGVEQKGLEQPEGAQITWLKQDLPFAAPIDQVNDLPVIGVRSRVSASDARVEAKFRDGSPALTARSQGRGTAAYCAFLPGLSYYRPALPKRPMDRGATDDSMMHFLPTKFNATAAKLIGAPARAVARPVECGEPLVETMVIRAEQGVVIPLVNWSGKPLEDLRVIVRTATPTASVSLASGGKVESQKAADGRVYRLNLKVADALIFR